MKPPACLVCGKPLIYTEEAVELRCEKCGKSFLSNSKCVDGHYICDICHSRDSMSVIKEICLASESKNPYAVALEIMRSPAVHMHGPEHHVIIGASLITAFQNAGGEIANLIRALNTIEERGKKVPGGICGNWGCCGAAVGAGIFLSVAMKASPLSVESWGLCNLLTSKCLNNIGALGGPRCCKRNVRLAIETAVDFIAENLNIVMEKTVEQCEFCQRNSECIRERCPFFEKRREF